MNVSNLSRIRDATIPGGIPGRTCAAVVLVSSALLVGLCPPSLAQIHPPLERLPTSSNVPAPHGSPLAGSPRIPFSHPGQNDVVRDTSVLNGRTMNLFAAHSPQPTRSDSPTGESGGPFTGQPTVSEDHQKLSDMIRDASAARRRALDHLRARAPHLAPQDEPGAYGHQFGELRNRMSQSRNDLVKTYNRLDKKLAQLEGVLKNNSACQPQPSAAELQPSPRTPLPDTPPEHRQPAPTSEAPGEADQQATLPTPQVMTPQLPSTIAQPIVDAIVVTNEPVDQMSLANNLAATGEDELALQIYQKIDLDNLSNRDAVWVRYQIANCQQQLGNHAAAQRGFRQVTSAADGGWWSKHAHWRLDTNDKTARLRKRLDQLEAQLRELEKGAAHDETPPQ